MNLEAKRFKKVYLEISNICNLQCSFCPEVGREKKWLDRDHLRRSLAEIKPHAERVCFHVMGEPLNHPHFTEFVEEAAAQNIPLEITSNGTLLNERTLATLLNPTIAQVNFSLQSFIDNFPKANPDSYLNKIFEFCKQAATERPELYVNLRLWNLSEGGEAAARNEYFFTRIEQEFGTQLNRNVDPGFNKSKRITGRLYLHFDSRFEWPSPEQPLRSERGTCHGTRSHVAIHADGTVVPCCLDKEARLPLGRLGETPFNDIIDGKRATSMRQGFERGELVEDLCRRCDYIQRF